MTRLATIATVVLLAALANVCLQPVPAAASEAEKFFDPQYCPNTIRKPKIQPSLAAYGCKGIVIPWGLCRRCHMRKHDSKGNFGKNNRDMYDLALPGCQYALKTYVKKNPCDWPRKRDINGYANVLKGKVKGWKAKKYQKDLGEFMYNVCELCCDCVPIGLSRKRSLAAEYKFRKDKDNKKTTPQGLIEIFRGNCPVHYYYDTCRMWPNLRDVASNKKWLNLKKDLICQNHVYPWWRVKKNRDNWLRRKFVPNMSKRFIQFLIKMNKVLGCRNKRVWIDCARLEMAQKRV